MNASGYPVQFYTGLATLGSGVCLAAMALIFGPLSVLLRRRRPAVDEDAGISHRARLVTGVCFVAFIIPMAIPSLNLVLAFEAVQFEGGANSSVSLEYGLALVRAAVLVGYLGAVMVLSVANAITVPGAWSRSPWRVARRRARQRH